MQRTHDGGPAFPVPGLQQDESFNGMTLRDYFAAKVLAMSIADPGTSEVFAAVDGQPQLQALRFAFAKGAYDWADAMLEARSA